MKYKIRLDICTLCNLNCPACGMRKNPKHENGNGYLTFENFKKFIDRDGDKIEYIEISNYGEPLLNPDFIKIAKYAYEHQIVLDCGNGTNLNIRNDDVLKALVDYQVLTITVSCDGVSQKAYEKYRVNGDVNLVFDNIRKINEYKLQRRSPYPMINWQYILRESSEDEAELAVEKAKELNVNNLFFKLTFEKDYIPKNEEWLKKVTGLKQVTRKKFNTENKTNYGQKCCQLWQEPAINWNGDLLGCCRNKKSFGVNVFEVGLDEALKNTKYNDSKMWAEGKIPELPQDNPCVKCNIYKTANELHQSPITDNMPLILQNAIQMKKEDNNFPKNITIFSLDLNNYFVRPIQKMCLKSWYEWKENNNQIKDIIIFNEESEEFKQFLELLYNGKYIDKSKGLQCLDGLCYIADAFRMYILSKYPNYLWLDGDVFIDNSNYIWKRDFFFTGCWNMLFNGINVDFYKKIFNIYLTEDIKGYNDAQITNKFGFNSFITDINYKELHTLAPLHLCKLENILENNNGILVNLNVYRDSRLENNITKMAKIYKKFYSNEYKSTIYSKLIAKLNSEINKIQGKYCVYNTVVSDIDFMLTDRLLKGLKNISLDIYNKVTTIQYNIEDLNKLLESDIAKMEQICEFAQDPNKIINLAKDSNLKVIDIKNLKDNELDDYYIKLYNSLN